MRYMNKKTEKLNSSEKNKSFRSNKRLWQRILSFITVFALVINTMYSGGLFGLFDFPMKVNAAVEITYTPDNLIGVFANTTAFSFSNDNTGKKKFVDYCYYYNTDDDFADYHKGDVLSLAFDALAESFSFMGLGNDTYPFTGRVTFLASDGMANITLPRALFTHVSTDARLTDSEATPSDITLEITKNSSASSPLLADYVHAGTGAATWKISVASGNTNSFAGVIGEIEANTSINLTFNNQSSATVSNTATGDNDIKDVGEICGIMKTGSSLTVTDNTTTRTAVSSSSGNAGSLVGTMEGTAALTLTTHPALTSISVTSENGYAGGLVGEMASAATISGLSSPEAISGNVTGTTGAGGLYGHYTNSAATFDLKDYNITATVSADYCGGVFGVLGNNKGEGSAITLTIKNTGAAGTLTANSGATANASSYFGGIAGKYTTDNLTNSLIIDGLSLTANANASYSAFGGAIGIVDSAAYVQTSNTVSVTATGTTASSYFGGFVGATSEENGVFVDLSSFTLNTDSEEFKGGGIVGLFNKGVLRISGTTTMTNAKPASADNCGQLVGKNDNVLVYTPGSWTYARSNGALADDLGTWGEVVRIADIETNILTLDSTNHTVTVGASVPSMTTRNHLVLNALNMQLDNCGCLVMSGTRSAMYSTNLSLGANLSFAGTGITGFMRDGGSVSDIGCYTGTFNGGNYMITLAIGEKYGSGITSSSTAEGIGQIYRHQHNGLFANLAGIVQNLTIDGTINVSNCVAGMNIGGVASRNGGNITLTKVVANQVVNYYESSSVSVDTSKAEGKNIGGYIGYVGTKGNITINGVSSIGATFNLSGKHQSWNVYGGAIGKVTAPTFNITIGTKDDTANKLTVGMVADVTGINAIGGNGDCGGLIGHITSAGSYGSRIVNINNLIFDDVTVGETTKTPTIANTASNNAGGFLGYSWLNSTVNINGLTVTKGNINNCTTSGTAGSNSNVGVMCYEATGKWNVDKLTITNMTMSNGGDTSVGMLVNKAYSGDNGLYLNVLNSGYTLTAATLPSLKKFDEIAAYSAKDANAVVQGDKGVGVISINMNAGRHNPESNPADTYTDATITTLGTYQNQLTGITCSQTSKYANPTTRYYYNLDVMNKDTDTAQDIMLWSVNQYAASNIKGEFVSSSTPFACAEETDVALSDYSYYPVYNVSSQTLSNINLKFGYNGIVTTVEGISNTDSYNRDPGEQNQHYLMQSGLFINSAENSTITLDTVELSGDFLENSTYQGVLISGTASGSIAIDGLVLEGISPKYNNSGTISNYNTGYLLVKNVNRADSTKGNIQINLANISTSDKYTVSSSTATVAKSLFGDVYGPAIGINIEDVKLDARSANGGLTALDTAYGTQKSIFTTATFFNSVKTSQAATMIYNYELSDDWPTSRNVTYGREVSESVEYADQENKYYNSTTNYTDPTTASHTSAPEYDFSSWLPYVGQVYTANQTADSNGCFFREIKVNVAAVTYSEGCGTYNDPYLIDSGAKLTAIAALINDASKTSDLPSVILPKTLYDGVAANTTGARWCDSKSDHAVYEWNGSNYTSTDSTAVWSVENVRLYLANAYYSISASTDNGNGNIVLGSGFLGLGGTADTTDNSGKFAFRGVIVGNGKTIVNNGSSPLVNVSNGCVIKDLTVNQNANVSIQEQTTAGTSAYFGYNSQCKYYGGLIGEIMGGDNIIDNSYVTYTSGKTVTLSGTYGTIVPVGGYVGVIVYGGLIFKNMTATVTGGPDLLVNNSGLTVYYSTNKDNLAADTTVAKAAIYVNPIVGRVINGYAVNEGSALSVTENGTYHDDANSGAGTTREGTQHSLKNGKKHYSIADIKKYSTLTEAEKLDVTAVATASADGTINVPNAQALFVLSLITQSCAGTATNSALGVYNNSLSYGTYDGNVYGMSHNAEYSDVGTNNSLADDDPATEGVDETGVPDYQKLAYYDTACNDTGNNTTFTNNAPIPYIIKHYTKGGTNVGITTWTETKTRTSTREVFNYDTTYGETEFTTLDDLDGQVLVVKGKSNLYMTGNAKPNPGNRRNAVLELSSNLSDAVEIHFDKQSNGKYLLWCGTESNKQYLKITALDPNASNITEWKPLDRGNLILGTEPYEFTIQYEPTNKYWGIYGSVKVTAGKYGNFNVSNDTIKDMYINCDDNNNNNRYYYSAYIEGQAEFGQNNFDPGNKLKLFTRTITSQTRIEPFTEEYDEEYEEIHTDYATTHNYPARCVTSTDGYYNINLATGVSYQLPDSFRGLGCVGMYDSAVPANVTPTVATLKANQFSIKLDKFDGKGCTIDEDIYLNKFKTDNYFDVLHAGGTQSLSADTKHYFGNENSNYGLRDNHGIGLFDSVITKGASSDIGNFTLTGSVNTEIYSNTYSSANKESIFVDDGYSKDPEVQYSLWLSVGGVCGWSTDGVYANFSNIALNDLTVRGADYVGGLLGISGNSSNTIKVSIKKCSATGISLEMNSAHQIGSAAQGRNAMGAFVGKAHEGAVVIYGTDHDYSTTNGLRDVNDDLSDYSEVKIKSFTFADSNLNYYASVGGLVGYSGHGFKAYDMKVSSSDTAITVGKSDVTYSGGIVGIIQPYSSGNSEGYAEFINCTVESINVAGIAAGGFYGGKWLSAYVPYSIDFSNCKLIGNENTITGANYAGGLVGHGTVYTRIGNDSNITISDSTVKGYTITANAGKYSGGFIGYCATQTNSITTYIHDSSVENCVIGQSGAVDYAGGAVGGIAKKTDNKIVGYNIKLDNVTSPSSRMGAWVGWMDTSDSNTDIQFTGIAIYGTGYDKNIGNWTVANNQANKNASFVFADYDGTCCGVVPEGETEREYPTDISSFNYNANTHVDMPKYPYVNINPQSSMGTGEIISGDGAILRKSASETAAYAGKTAENTMALKLYEDSKLTNSAATNYSRRYTTFSDDEIYNGNKISYYMQRTITDDGDRISNYYDEKGYTTNQSYDNFACIVIANNTTPETTDLINRYAQLVTNTTTDYSGTDESNDYFDIVISPCVLKNGTFVIDTSANAEAGLTYSNGQFSLNSSGADSMKSGDTFTLVDIQFKDPLDTNKIAYHLYIPVYTIKEIEVTFKAAVMNGTNSVSYDVNGDEETNPYDIKLGTAALDTHVDNLNTWYTTYIRYTYSHVDIEALLNTGNLNWNHNKYFYLDRTGFTATSMLPANTYMILVDPNGDHDNKYQVLLNTDDFARQSGTTSRITFDLTKFSDGNDNFSVCTFNELVAQKLTASTNTENNGRYNLCSEIPENPNTGITQYVYTKDATGEATYYEYVGSGGAYDIKLADGDVYENYYISMFVPGATNDTSLYGYYIRTPESFEAPSYTAGTNNAITKSANVRCHYGDNATTQNRQVYIGNLFTQETELTVLPDNLEIDNGNHTLNIYAKTTIKPRDSNVTTILQSVNADIYHSFNIYLDRKGENDQITNHIYGYDDDSIDIKAWYSVGTEIPIGEEEDMEVAGINKIDASKIDLQSSYINIATIDGGQTVLNTSGVTINSRIRLDFDDYESEFPQKMASDTGVSVRAASNLAYDSNSLAFSSMSAPLEEPAARKHIYYRQSLNTASLKYSGKTELDEYDTDGLASENTSRLGVSGKYSMNEYMPVNSTAQYNVQNIESALGEADELVLTLALQKKTDSPSSRPYTSSSYQDVSSINAYWGAVQRNATTHEVAPNDKGKPVTVADTTNLRIKCGTYDEIEIVPANTTVYTLVIPKAATGTPGFTVDESGYIYIDIGFNAKTGVNFTEYANYKVNLKVELRSNTTGVISGSYADDYMIYTNAKVNHDFLKGN